MLCHKRHENDVSASKCVRKTDARKIQDSYARKMQGVKTLAYIGVNPLIAEIGVIAEIGDITVTSSTFRVKIINFCKVKRKTAQLRFPYTCLQKINIYANDRKFHELIT